LVRRFLGDESGATAIEYGLIAAGIAVAIIVAVNAVGTDLSSLFGRSSAKLNAAGN
jgi:pilus assembly protein Flp/PilA